MNQQIKRTIAIPRKCIQTYVRYKKRKQQADRDRERVITTHRWLFRRRRRRRPWISSQLYHQQYKIKQVELLAINSYGLPDISYGRNPSITQERGGREKDRKKEKESEKRKEKSENGETKREERLKWMCTFLGVRVHLYRHTRTVCLRVYMWERNK